MGRANRRTKKGSNPPPGAVTAAFISTLPGPTSTIAIAADPTLGYKIRVLLYDFLNVTKDPNSERRINSTTDEHYISAPYFEHDQAMVVKAAIVDADLPKHDPSISDYTDGKNNENSSERCGLQGQTFDAAVRTMLNQFIDKRRASGDARPCGPHHLAPLYASLFGIGMEEIQDSKFLSRLRRAGI